MIVLAGRDDPLFSLGYTRQVFKRVSAPQKELIVFDTDRHLLFNEALPLVLGPVIDVVTRLDGERLPTGAASACRGEGNAIKD